MGGLEELNCGYRAEGVAREDDLARLDDVEGVGELGQGGLRDAVIEVGSDGGAVATVDGGEGFEDQAELPQANA